MRFCFGGPYLRQPERIWLHDLYKGAHDRNLANVADCGGSCGSSVMQDKEALWTGYGPFTHKPCETCSVAPLCMAGCAWEAMKTSAEETGFCSSNRFNLADELRLFDLSQMVAEAIRKKDAELEEMAGGN